MMTNTFKNRTLKSGFTLIEILVVIAIIAVLAGVLLAALSNVQKAAKRTKTITLMQSFGRACDEFALDHGRYPGLLPDAAIDGINLTSAQNALLELMGGARVKHSQSPQSVVDEYDEFAADATTQVNAFDPVTGLQWVIAFNELKFGEGPWIAGRVYAPYFSPKSSDITYVPFDPMLNDFKLPSLIDAWETPIIYLRAGRTSGPIIDDPSNGLLPQFDLPGLNQLLSDGLNTGGSVIGSTFSPNDESRIAWLSLLLSHPTFWEDNGSGSAFNNGVVWGTSRGRYALISAGYDKIFLEIANPRVHVGQDIDPGDPLGSLLDPQDGIITPSTMDTFNDVLVFGGA